MLIVVDLLGDDDIVVKTTDLSYIEVKPKVNDGQQRVVEEPMLDIVPVVPTNGSQLTTEFSF